MFKPVVYLIPLLAITMISCESSGKETEPLSTSEKQPDSVATVSKPVADTTYNRYLFDTTRRFSNSMDLIRYWNDIQQTYFEFRKKALDTARDKQRLEMTLDSLTYLNSSLLAYASLQFLKAKPDKSEKDLFLLISSSDLTAVNITYEEVMEVFNAFPEAAKKSPAGLKILEKLKEKDNLKFTTDQIKPLKVKDSLNRDHSFDELLSGDYDYHIIVFGASWCKPCRIENHSLKSRLAITDLSRVHFIGISIDTDRKKWINALRQDECTWPQYNEPLGYNSILSKTINLTGVPDNILIDRNGKLLMRSRNVDKLIDKISKDQK